MEWLLIKRIREFSYKILYFLVLPWYFLSVVEYFVLHAKKKKNYGDEKMLSITNQGNANQTTVRYYLSTVRMAVIKETESNKCQ